MKCTTFGLLLTLGLSGQAWAHARWKVGSKVTPPRDISTGLKTAPCGGVARTATPIQFKPGATVTVELEETINHLGYFEVRFLPANDTAPVGTDNLMLKIIDDQNTPVTAPQFHQFTGVITMPATKCDGCTLQLIQVMQDGGPNAPSSNYYSCSDIQLVDNPQAPAPTPAPPAPPKPANPNAIKPDKPVGLKLENAVQGVKP